VALDIKKPFETGGKKQNSIIRLKPQKGRSQLA
jgi:hypothetical protein